MDSLIIEQKIREILEQKTGLDPAQIQGDVSLLRGGLELDSLTIASFVMEIQKVFGIDLLEEDLTLSSLESITALVHFIWVRVL
jgi:acyl carrier protein